MSLSSRSNVAGLSYSAAMSLANSLDMEAVECGFPYNGFIARCSGLTAREFIAWMKYGLEWVKVFQLNVLNATEDKREFIKCMTVCPGIMRYPIWQMMSSRSAVMNSLRYTMRKELDSATRGIDVLHPYKNPDTMTPESLDKHIVEACRGTGRFSYDSFIMSYDSENDLYRDMKAVSRSLYVGLVIQPDVISAMPADLQKIMADSMEVSRSSDIYRIFVVNLLKSDAPAAVKCLALESETLRLPPIPEEHPLRFLEYSSYEEFRMKLLIAGDDNFDFNFALHLYFNDRYMFEWMCAKFPDTVDSAIGCHDI